MSEETTVPDLYRLAFMPGCFRCPQCEFVLTKACINPDAGVIGTREQDRQSEPCPNDGTMMVHVTYREQLEVYANRLKEEFERTADLKRALADERARLEYLRDKLMQADESVSDALGLPRGWVDLYAALDAARRKQ